ncbi:MAG: Omp28-related outer membrane protein [Flavobacteriales bacterium]|nr:Omp28-related outer membrane protein [Flavobacteriales bacterium]
MRHASISLMAAMALAGCDIVSDPVQPSGNTVGPVEGIPRRVLLEDLTGHRCNNCPRAARVADGLATQYGDQLVIVGVHMVNGFAAPQNPIGDGIFDTDFRTPAGSAYEAAFQIEGLPMGMFNRFPFNGARAITDGAWPSAMAAAAGQEADLDIRFTSFTFNAANSSVSGEIEVTIAKPMEGTHDLVIYLTEDHVIDWQVDAQAPSPNVPDYEHRHVLRAVLNGTWGESVFEGSASAGDRFTRSFSYTLPTNVLESANCALVAYVAHRDSYEVKQVTERKFQP